MSSPDLQAGTRRRAAAASLRWDVAARVVLALPGGYALAYAATAFLTTYLPLPRPDRVVYASLACFAVWTAAVLYAFAARSAWRAGALLIGLSLALLLGAWLPADLGARP